MSEFVEVALLDQVLPGTSSFVQVRAKSIALFNVDSRIHAGADSCAHQGA
jgi:nitrite reductase/ring-hydroxylating ferredoxin subunit